MEKIAIVMLVLSAVFISIHFYKKSIIHKESVKPKRECSGCEFSRKKEYAEAYAMSEIAASLAETIKMMEDFCKDDQMCDYYKRNVIINMQEAREIYSKLIFTRDWIMFKKDSKEKTEDAKDTNQEQR
jgi:hypothetical protein